jgi:hypothetical protein
MGIATGARNANFETCFEKRSTSQTMKLDCQLGDELARLEITQCFAGAQK